METQLTRVNAGEWDYKNIDPYITELFHAETPVSMQVIRFHVKHHELKTAFRFTPTMASLLLPKRLFKRTAVTSCLPNFCTGTTMLQ